LHCISFNAAYDPELSDGRDSRTLTAGEYLLMEKIAGDPYNEVKGQRSPQTRGIIQSNLLY
jgi:hypothetical protein